MDIFSIEQVFTQGFRFFKEPRAFLFEESIVVCFDGRQYAELSYSEIDDELVRFHTGYEPKVFVYSFKENNVSGVSLPKTNIAILDIFVYENEIFILSEQFDIWKNIGNLFSSNTYLLKIEDNRAAVNIIIPGSTVGHTPLIIKGDLFDDIYYYPSMSGIRTVSMKDLSLNFAKKLSLTHHEEVEIKVSPSGLILVCQRVDLIYGAVDGNFFIDEKVHTTEIRKYDNDFNEIKNLIFQYTICDIYWGTESVLIGVDTPYFQKLMYNSTLYIEIDPGLMKTKNMIRANNEIFWFYEDNFWIPIY